MTLVILPDYPTTREYLPKCCSQWHYIIEEDDQLIYGGIQEI
jgi:hypothetical protein